MENNDKKKKKSYAFSPAWRKFQELMEKPEVDTYQAVEALLEEYATPVVFEVLRLSLHTPRLKKDREITTIYFLTKKGKADWLAYLENRRITPALKPEQRIYFKEALHEKFLAKPIERETYDYTKIVIVNAKREARGQNKKHSPYDAESALKLFRSLVEEHGEEDTIKLMLLEYSVPAIYRALRADLRTPRYYKVEGRQVKFQFLTTKGREQWIQTLKKNGLKLTGVSDSDTFVREVFRLEVHYKPVEKSNLFESISMTVPDPRRKRGGRIKKNSQD
jgi:hypothetical protein